MIKITLAIFNKLQITFTVTGLHIQLQLTYLFMFIQENNNLTEY